MTKTADSITVKDIKDFFEMTSKEMMDEWKSLDKDDKDELKALLAEFLNKQ